MQNTRNLLPGVVITFLGAALVLATLLPQLLMIDKVPTVPNTRQGILPFPQIPVFPITEPSNPNHPDAPLQQVKIQRVPAGEAPLEMRKAWQDVILPATMVYTQARGLLTGEVYGPRDFYAVEKSTALNLLRQKDPGAADWFANLPQFANEQYFLFEAP